MHRTFPLVLTLCASTLAGCGDDPDKDTASSPTTPSTTTTTTTPSTSTTTTPSTTTTAPGDIDADGDGFSINDGDCDDNNAGTYPGNTANDLWYDGVDTDCAGNNDYDQDGDGYMWDRDANEAAYVVYVVASFGGTPPWAENWGDCLDNDLDRAPLLGASLFPGQAEVWYDGIDSDCALDNDFDQDGDGTMPAFARDATHPDNLYGTSWADYEADWSTGINGGFHDCDDTDPAILLGTLELLGDGFDSDCDGFNDTTPFAFDGLAWDNPRPPRLEATGQHYILATSADTTDLGFTQLIDVGTALTFDLGSELFAPVDTNILWLGITNPLPLGDAVDVTSRGDDFWTSTSYSFPGSNTYLVSKRLTYMSALGSYIQDLFNWTLSSPEFQGVAVDLELDELNGAWSVACGDTSLHANQAFPDDPITQTVAIESVDPIQTCFWNAQPISTSGMGQVVSCTATDCQMYDFIPDNGSLTLSASQPWAGTTLRYGTYREGYHHLLFGGAGAFLSGPSGDFDVLTDYQLTSVDADWRDTDGDLVNDTLYVIGVGEPIIPDGLGMRVLLAHGDPNVSMNVAVLPFEDASRPTLVPTAAGIHVDANRLFIAVSGHDNTGPVQDAIGWAFLGWP